MMRGVMLAGLCLAGPAMAQPIDCVGAARSLWPASAVTPTTPCAIAPWGAGLVAVATLVDEGDLRAGLLSEADRLPVATGRIEPLTLAPPVSPILGFQPLPRIAPGAVGVTLSNGYYSTSGSLSSQSVHVFLRQGDALRPVLAVLRRAAHNHAARCRPGQASPCRQGWTRQWSMTSAGPASDGAPPAITLRDARTGRIASRHRWAGQAYTPAVFDRTPPVPPS